MGAVRAALIVAAVLAFFFALPAAGSQPQAYGRELVAQYQLPSEAVARYAALIDGSKGPDDARDRAARIDNAVWVGPLQAAGAGRNPYTLVLTVRGVAQAAGDIRSQWQTGWELRESPVATREVLMPLAGMASTGVAAGAPVTLIAVSSPLSFRGERQVAPLVSLVAAHNLEINDVQLQVWSGSAPMAWPALSAPRPALLAIGALCVFGWFVLSRQPRSAAAPVPARASRLPANTRPAPLEHEPAPERPLLPVPPAPSQASRVVAALHDVLTAGLSVPTESDPRRSRRRPSTPA
jgi:hypothetical protein